MPLLNIPCSIFNANKYLVCCLVGAMNGGGEWVVFVDDWFTCHYLKFIYPLYGFIFSRFHILALMLS